MIAYAGTKSAPVQYFHPESAVQNPSEHLNHTECPMWFNYYSSATNNCQCFQFWPLKCDDKYASVDPDQILTYDSHRGLILAIKIRHIYLGGYNMTKTGFIILPDEIFELNPYMCGPLNRKGYLCGECKSGYGPGPFLTSCTKLMYAIDTWHEILLYLSLHGVHSHNCILSPHPCISNQADFCTNDLLYYVQSADCARILQRVCKPMGTIIIQSSKILFH
jgi:hypothetical protein